MRAIQNFNNYSITEQGKVYNRHGREIKPSDNGKGYLQVILVNDQGERKKCYIHKLVAVAYIPNPHNKAEVNHLKTKYDNDVDSLEWVTSAENKAHAKQFRDGVTSKFFGVCWSKSHKKWHARININKINKHLGFFDDEEEAAKAYLDEAKVIGRINKYAIAI